MAEPKNTWKIATGLVSLAIFILGLKLMQEGARALGPFLEKNVDLESMLGAFGFGWGAACALLSGSPVAAMAVTFFDAGQIGQNSAFAMINGSRVGATWFLLLLGLFYLTRRRHSLDEVRIAVLVFLVTVAVYLPAFAVGYAALETGLLAGIGDGEGLGNALKNTPFDLLTDQLTELLPRWAVFVVGLALIIGSFKLFDMSLPEFDEDNEKLKALENHVYRPWRMFGIGALVTLLSMSVSISLALLMPLNERGIIRTRHVVPYILGANITTFIDTFVAAATMEKAAAMTVVLVQVVAIAVVSLIVMAGFYERFKTTMLAGVDMIAGSKRNLILFAAASTLVPMVLVGMAMMKS